MAYAQRVREPQDQPLTVGEMMARAVQRRDELNVFIGVLQRTLAEDTKEREARGVLP